MLSLLPRRPFGFFARLLLGLEPGLFFQPGPALGLLPGAFLGLATLLLFFRLPFGLLGRLAIFFGFAFFFGLALRCLKFGGILRRFCLLLGVFLRLALCLHPGFQFGTLACFVCGGRCAAGLLSGIGVRYVRGLC